MNSKINKFIEDSKRIHGDVYDYSLVSFKTTKDPVTLICKEHGEFIIKRAVNHTAPSRKQKCPGCTKYASDITRGNFEDFLKKAKEAHGEKYDYSKVEYISTHEHVNIICPVHGEFPQTPSNHYKYGCRKCGMKESSKKQKGKASSYNKRGFITVAKNRKCYFYVLHCYNEKESFFKVGITSRSIEERFRKKDMPYSFDVLHLIEGTPGDIWKLEHLNKKLLKSVKYTPEIAFSGSITECFSDLQQLSLTISPVEESG